MYILNNTDSSLTYRYGGVIYTFSANAVSQVDDTNITIGNLQSAFGVEAVSLLTVLSQAQQGTLTNANKSLTNLPGDLKTLIDARKVSPSIYDSYEIELAILQESMGAKTDSSQTDPTQVASSIALLKGILSSINTLITDAIKNNYDASGNLNISQGTTLIATSNSWVLVNPVIDALVPQFASIVPSGTSINYSYKGTSNSYIIDSSEYNVISGTETEFYDQERIVASVSNETQNMSSAKSFTIHSILKTDTPFLSPLIDTVRNSELILSNIIGSIQRSN